MVEYNNHIEIENKKYKINPNFKNIIEIEKIMKDKEVEVENKIIKSLSSFYLFFDIEKKEFQDIEKLSNHMLNWIYPEKKGAKKGKKSKVKIYDYEIDWDLIYSAFYECYKIRLTSYMHWYEFKQLFEGLNSECKFCKVQSYRAYEGKDKDMKDLKEYWELPKENSLSKEAQKELIRKGGG